MTNIRLQLTRRRLLERAVHFGILPFIRKAPQGSSVALTHDMGIGGVTDTSACYRARAGSPATISIEYRDRG